MNTEQIQAELDRLLPLVLANGIESPRLEYKLRAAESPIVHMTWYVRNTFTVKTWPDFRAFSEWLHALPTPETAALNAHNDRIADVIDKARDAGIADEYVTPLVAVRAAISTNLLTVA